MDPIGAGKFERFNFPWPYFVGGDADLGFSGALVFTFSGAGAFIGTGDLGCLGLNFRRPCSVGAGALLICLVGGGAVLDRGFLSLNFS